MDVFEHQDIAQYADHFRKVHNVEGTILLDDKEELFGILGLRGVPMNVVVDKKGIIRAVGMTSPDEVRATLTRLMRPF